MYQRAKFAVRILCIVLSGALCFLSTACGKTPSSSPESSWDTGTASSSDQSENPSQSVAVPENQTSSDGSTTGNRPSPSSKNAAPTRGNTPTSRITTASTEAPTSSPTVTTPKEPAMSVLSLTDKAVLAKVKIQGRSGPVSSGISFDWSANTLEFQAVCEGSVSLNLKEKASDTMYYTVLVDGKEQARARSSGSRLLLAENLPKGDHTFQVVRHTESFVGQVTLCSIELKGQLKSRPADRPLYMEFLGDSITVGLGNLCLGLPQPASDYSENQDGTQSYAYLTAQALGADISVLARSGIGAYHGWDGGNPALPPMYESISYYRDKTAPWAFSRQAEPGHQRPVDRRLLLGADPGDAGLHAAGAAEESAGRHRLGSGRHHGRLSGRGRRRGEPPGWGREELLRLSPALRPQQGRQRPPHRRTASLHGRQPGRLSAAEPPGLRLLTLCRLPLCLQPLPLPLAAGAFFRFSPSDRLTFPAFRAITCTYTESPWTPADGKDA